MSAAPNLVPCSLSPTLPTMLPPSYPVNSTLGPINQQWPLPGPFPVPCHRGTGPFWKVSSQLTCLGQNQGFEDAVPAPPTAPAAWPPHFQIRFEIVGNLQESHEESP